MWRGEVSPIDESYLPLTPNFAELNTLKIKLVESLSSVLINCKVGWDGFFERELNMYISQIMRHVILQKIFFNFRRSLLKPSNNNIKKGMNITGFPTFIFQPLTSLHNALDYLTNNLLLLSRNPHFWTRFTGKLQILQTLHRPQSKLSQPKSQLMFFKQIKRFYTLELSYLIEADHFQ